MADFINTIDALGDDVVMQSLIDKSITEFRDDVITSIGAYAFSACTNLTVLDMPSVTGTNTRCCNGCTNLTIARFNNLKGFGSFFFTACNRLRIIALGTNAVVTIAQTLTNNPLYVLVPSTLISNYQSATNWSSMYSAGNCIFYALEDYTVDGTTTGELDEDKIATLLA